MIGEWCAGLMAPMPVAVTVPVRLRYCAVRAVGIGSDVRVT